MTNTIERYISINTENLSGEFYFQSFLTEAYERHEISETELETIQLDCFKLLAARTESYNNGASSSVQIEVAQVIMASNFFTIGLYLKSLPDLQTALQALKNEPIAEQYQRGLKIVCRKMNVARHLYYLVCSSRIKSMQCFYNVAIDEDLKRSIKNYNLDYEAHEMTTVIDYQLMNPVSDLAGVEYLVHYLHNLSLENMFCAMFKPAVIHAVMQEYDREYKDLPVNFFEQVLLNALGCVLLRKDFEAPILTAADRQEMISIMQCEDGTSPFALFNSTADSVIEGLSITSLPLKAYIKAALPALISSF
jgi:hypothetical protein